MKSPVAVIWVIAFGLCSARSKAQAPEQGPDEAGRSVQIANQRLIERFQLFPTEKTRACCNLSARGLSESKRLLHQAGDPDSLFTIGSPGPYGEVRLQAAVEVNEVVLRALAPDLRVDPSDTRFRSAGDYRALDATGRPYQFRLGAKLVW